jgi:hypothetical protein
MSNYDTPAGGFQPEHRLNLRDVQRDNYFGNSSMPLGMSLIHRPTGIKVSGTGRPDNNRRDTGWKLYEELLGSLGRAVTQHYEDQTPEGQIRVKEESERANAIQDRETRARHAAIGMNPNDIPGSAQQQANTANAQMISDQSAQIAALQAQVALLIQLQSGGKKD